MLMLYCQNKNGINFFELV